jgi:two-component system, response regulator PdtaR
MTVLVVDDDPFVRMAAAATLQEAGYEVTEASNADEALRALDNGE